jgi:hypothetical protein
MELEKEKTKKRHGPRKVTRRAKQEDEVLGFA